MVGQGDGNLHEIREYDEKESSVRLWSENGSLAFGMKG